MTLILAVDAYMLADANLVGWAWAVDQDNWACGCVEDSASVSQAQFRAIFSFVRRSHEVREPLVIYTSSEYVAAVLQTWRHQWRSNQWRKLDGMPVTDLQLIRNIDRFLAGKSLQVICVGSKEEDLLLQAHIYAREVAYAHRDGQEPNLGPGFHPELLKQRRGKKSQKLIISEVPLLKPKDSVPDNVARFPRSVQPRKSVTNPDRQLYSGPVDVGGLGSPARGAAANLRPITQVVRDQDLRFQKYCASANRVQIREMMHPDFMSIGELGVPISRTEAAALLAEDPPSPSEVEVRELGPHTAQVIYFDSGLVQSWIWTRYQNNQARLIFQQITKRPLDVF
ncbi:RNase H family protein [Varibaculum vaginae]|uniref:RNase H family protein n=1 Tax=Varibaculum vaginae TaxID=2364797 RepID=UPI000F097183|nr:RNase H family protein [Varibaculum vaginae]